MISAADVEGLGGSFTPAHDVANEILPQEVKRWRMETAVVSPDGGRCNRRVRLGDTSVDSTSS